MAAVEHFTRLPELVAAQHGVTLCHETLLELAHDVGGAAERMRLAEARSSAARREPPPVTLANPPNRVYVSVDGSMSCTNPTEPDADHPGQKRLKWQQMKVGCVDWQDDRQRWQKQMVWGRESPEAFAASLWRLARQCGYGQAFIAKATFPRQSIVIANPPPVAVRGGRRRLVLGHSGP